MINLKHNIVNSQTAKRFVHWYLDNPIKPYQPSKHSDYSHYDVACAKKILHSKRKYFFAKPFVEIISALDHYPNTGQNFATLAKHYAFTQQSIKSLGIHPAGLHYSSDTPDTYQDSLTPESYLKYLREQEVVPYSTIKEYIANYNQMISKKLKNALNKVKAYNKALVNQQENKLKAIKNQKLSFFKRHSPKVQFKRLHKIQTIKERLHQLKHQDHKWYLKLDNPQSVVTGENFDHFTKKDWQKAKLVTKYDYYCHLVTLNLKKISLRDIAKTPCFKSDLPKHTLNNKIHLTSSTILRDYRRFTK